MNIENKINQISILISQIQNTNNNNLSKAKKWMLSHNNVQQLTNTIYKLSVIDFHILDTLNNNEELIGSEIAKKLGITRGGVSRATRRMKKEDLIIDVHHCDNQKNIYFKLTSKGKKLAQLHQQMNDELYKKLQSQIASKYSLQELEIIANFLIDINNIN